MSKVEKYGGGGLAMSIQTKNVFSGAYEYCSIWSNKSFNIGYSAVLGQLKKCILVV